MLLALALDLVDEPGELGQVAAHPVQLLVDQRLLAVELLGAETALGREHLLIGAHELRDRGLGRGSLGCAILCRSGLELTEDLLDGHGGGASVPRRRPQARAAQPIRRPSSTPPATRATTTRTTTSVSIERTLQESGTLRR